MRTSLADSTVLNEPFANAPLKVLVLFRILRADMKTVGVLDGKCRILFHRTSTRLNASQLVVLAS